MKTKIIRKRKLVNCFINYEIYLNHRFLTSLKNGEIYEVDLKEDDVLEAKTDWLSSKKLSCNRNIKSVSISSILPDWFYVFSLLSLISYFIIQFKFGVGGLDVFLVIFGPVLIGLLLLIFFKRKSFLQLNPN